MGVKCKVDGCEKMAQQQGKCKAHLNGSEPRKSHFKNAAAIPAPVPTVQHIPSAAVDAPEPEEIRNTDYHAFLRQKYDERYESAVSRMNEARTPYELARIYILECDAIIGSEC